MLCIFDQFVKHNSTLRETLLDNAAHNMLPTKRYQRILIIQEMCAGFGLIGKYPVMDNFNYFQYCLGIQEQNGLQIRSKNFVLCFKSDLKDRI